MSDDLPSIDERRPTDVARRTELLDKLSNIDPAKLESLRFRTRVIGDAFQDSFADSFADSFSDSFADSFGDSFSDSSALTPAEQILERVRSAGPENLVGLEFKASR